MKCLHCGTELDRLSKWRGSSEYCSEECKKQNQDEFNRLAMSRLMQPRPARTTSRPASAAVRTMESPAGPLTVVTHPVGASSPVVTEPPEAGFIMEASATLVALALRHQPPLTPAPQIPVIPSSSLPVADSLLALQAMIAGLRPPLRPARKRSPFNHTQLRMPQAAQPPLELPASPAVWPASLGLNFQVEGLDGPSQVALNTTTRTAQPPAVEASAATSHSHIPSLRSARVLTTPSPLALGSDRAIQVPAVSAPRLRIHLPKPVLNPFRPRYAFAPPPAAGPAPSPAQDTTTATKLEVAPIEETAPAPRPEPARARQQATVPVKPSPPKSLPKAEPKPSVPKPEAKKAEARKTPLPEIRKAEPRAEPKPEEKPEPRTETVSTPQTFTAPSFGGSSEPEPEGFLSRIPGWAKAFAALAVVGGGLGLWLVPELNRGTARAASAPAPAAAPATMGPESWETDSSGDTSGIARRRVISLYKPARGKRDYIFEFSGDLEQRAMGWVFRMKDARNYYCLKLEQGTGAAPQLVKFAVVNGEEQPHRLVELRDPLPAGMPVKIRLDVRGQNFSTQVNGRPVDVWIDNQIPDGTVGFSNESGERAVIRSVKVTY